MELLSAEDADVTMRWRRFFEQLYNHSETLIRATAQVAFADVVDIHSAQPELIELLSRVHDRWWLRLSPENGDAHNESFMDPQTFSELPCSVRRRMHAERALVCLEQHFGSRLIAEVCDHFREQFNEGARRAEEHAREHCEMFAAALDNARAHAENRCERLEEGFVRERDRAAVAELVLADRGAQLRGEAHRELISIEVLNDC